MDRKWLFKHILACVVIVSVTLVAVGIVYAVHNLGLFELDRNALDAPAAGDDWETLYGGGGSAEAFTGIIADAPSPGTQFQGGGSKDDLPISSWRWQTGEPLDKDDITNAYAAAYINTTPTENNHVGDLIIYFGLDRFANNGSAQVGFWFFKNPVGLTRTVSGGGYLFSGSHTVGDILVQSNFTNGGVISSISVYKWVGSGGSNGTLDLILTAADCLSGSNPDDQACATVNQGNTPAPWPFTPKFGTAGTFPAGSFFEGGINLSRLVPNLGCFSTVMAETRSSTPFDSRLKDFTLGNFQLCGAKISIAPNGVNPVGANHVFTIDVEKKDASNGYTFGPAADVPVAATIVSGPGSFVGPSICNTGVDGTCTVTLMSDTPGITTVSAAATVSLKDDGSVVVVTDGAGGNSEPAEKTWVDANIQITPTTGTNAIGSPHTLTGHVNVNDGSGWADAPDGTTIQFSIVSGPGNLSAPSCTTSGGTGSCSVTLTSNTAGVTTVKATTDVTVEGVLLHRETDGVGSNSDDATKNWVDANIQITPATGTNAIGSPHTLTGHVNVNDGSGWADAPDGTTIQFSIVSGPGSLSAPSCTTSGGTGSCSVTLTSNTAGVTTVHASTSVVVGGVTLNRETDGVGSNSGDATKNWVDANIQITPATGTNAIGSPHTLTGHVNVNTGTGGYVNAPDGTMINFSIVSGPGSLSAPSCTTSGGTGSCSVTLTSNTAGVTTVQAETDVMVEGVPLHRETDGVGSNSDDATKNWVDANIQISPLTATNGIGETHTLTGHVNVNDGSGWADASDGTTIQFSIVSGPGSLSAPSCTTSGGTGSCSVTLTSNTAGVTTVHASTSVVVGGVTLNRETDGVGSNSGDATKNWVDANIQITPATGTNAIGSPHTLTGHVNVNTGTGGYVNAPDGTMIQFSIVSGPGNLSAPSCTTSGGTGSCSVTLTSNTAGVTTVKATTDVTVMGVVLHPETNGSAGNSEPAEKTWVDANIQISPLTATNGIGETHTLTGHVNVNDGSGWVDAPDGTTINFSIISGPGSLSAPSCTTSGGTGSCSVTLTSNTAGVTTVHASTTVIVGGVMLNRETNGLAGNSGDAEKTWVAGSLNWLKKDSSGALLGGATFQVCRTATYNSQTSTFTSITPVCVTVLDNSAPDADSTAGEFSLTGLILGRYTITETVPPPGYAGDPFVETIEITTSSPNGTASHVWVNTPNEGCTLGFWKTHTNLWDGAGSDDVTATYKTTNLFNATFGVSFGQSGLADTVTLLDALSVSGSNLMALNRQATAALINADAGIAFQYSAAQVIEMYQDAVGAIAGPEDISSALAKLTAANESYCPLN